MRKLASVQIIEDLQPIENAHNIEVASILGWKVVVRKDLHKVGDLVAFFELDSILPPIPVFDFMAARNYRVKTVKMRGQISQGLALPIFSIFSEDLVYNGDFEVGYDLTELLEVKKYELPENNSSPSNGGLFPYFITKTDEVRIQSEPELLSQLNGKQFYITQKMDGTSFTAFYLDGEFGVCSRNLEIWEGDNLYWNISRRYEIQESLENWYRTTGEFLFIQGEIVGPKINGGKTGLDTGLYLFTVGRINGLQKLELYDMAVFSEFAQIPLVPVLEMGNEFDMTLAELLEMVEKGVYTTGKIAEGIVVRSVDGVISFKVINNNYLLKHKE